MISRDVPKARLMLLVSLVLLGGVLASLAVAEDPYLAASYKRKGKINANQTETSSNDLSIRVQSKNNDFGIAFGLGPWLNAPGQIGRGKVVTLEEPSYKDEPCWEVTQTGYAAARGWRPRIRGTTATAAAVGCTMIFERLSQYERVYFPSEETNSILEVWLSGVDADPICLEPGEFVEVKIGRTDPLTDADIMKIADYPDRLMYVSRVLEQPIVFELPETRPPESSVHRSQ